MNNKLVLTQITGPDELLTTNKTCPICGKVFKAEHPRQLHHPHCISQHMKTVPVVSYKTFTNLIPNVDGTPPTEVNITIPVVWDSATGEYLMTPEALQLIDFAKVRGMLGVLYAEVGALKARVKYLEDHDFSAPIN